MTRKSDANASFSRVTTGQIAAIDKQTNHISSKLCSVIDSDADKVKARLLNIWFFLACLWFSYQADDALFHTKEDKLATKQHVK